jgi:ubiquinone/menaquinone biosynthesis C-methylase UbiE
MDLSSLDRVRTLYDESADSYSEMMDEEINLPMYAHALKGLAERIACLDGPVLDTSCGSGHMLERLGKKYAPGRPLVGVDLSPRMVAIVQRRLGGAAAVLEGDMRRLDHVSDRSCAAVLSFFALHHVDLPGLRTCFVEWFRVLRPGGQLFVAAWEGSGAMDYGLQVDLVAVRHRQQDVTGAVRAAGFTVGRCVVEPVEGMEMDAVYVEATA